MVDIDGSFEYSNTVSIKFEYPVGLSAYPNPVSDFMTIDLTSSIYEISPLVIYDCKGKKVMEKLMTIYQGINKITVTTSWLSSGCYFLSINGKNHYSFPFIKVVK
jgi:hypothetical protein